jgi:hypothetical protein
MTIWPQLSGPEPQCVSHHLRSEVQRPPASPSGCASPESVEVSATFAPVSASFAASPGPASLAPSIVVASPPPEPASVLASLPSGMPGSMPRRAPQPASPAPAIATSVANSAPRTAARVPQAMISKLARFGPAMARRLIAGGPRRRAESVAIARISHRHGHRHLVETRAQRGCLHSGGKVQSR